MKHLCLLCAVVLSIGGLVRAQDAGEEPAAGGFSLDATVTIPSSYVFRGYVLEEDHFIVQPEFTIGYDMEAFSLPVHVYATAWANLTDASAPGDPEWFNEFDAYLGADISLSGGFTLGIVYDYYNSPANVFDDVHEVGLVLSHDCVAKPAIGIYYEFCDKSSTEDTYIEFSLTPGFDVPQIEKLHIDFPLVLGITPDDYYTDSDGDGTVFGYCSAGISATYSISDQLSISASVSVVQMLADSTEDANDGDEQQYVGAISVSYSM